MSIAILATGDEIIHGDTLNTNGHTIAHVLNSEGLVLGLHLACSDQESDLMTCIDFLYQRHDVLILIGGLGPTSDDRTRFALARFLNVPLEIFPDAEAHIRARLARGNLPFNEGNRQQALFPAGALLFSNPYGTAMGCAYRQENKLMVLLPGPPRECLPMFHHHVLPLLHEATHHDTILLKWRLFGVAEGTIAETLDGALQGLDCETGYRLETPYLEFKVRCQRASIEAVKRLIEPLVAPYFIATPEQKASERLSLLIARLQQPVVILDEVTGGVVQSLIQRPSNYRWLHFYETTTEHAWHFHLTGLVEYWSQHVESPTTHVTLTCNGKGFAPHSETHELPYRSALVVEYAAEWLCFRIAQVIDKLHEFVA